MASTAVIALSKRGAALAQRLAAGLDPEADLYLERRYADTGQHAQSPEPHGFDLPLRTLLAEVWDSYDAIVLLLPVGAAVRLAAPLLRDKRSDPAVVSVDDAGRFAVSLISGHLGGADAMAQQVANVLGAEPVVTSGSHVTQTLAVDLLGAEFGWKVEADSIAVTRASAAVINREPVGVFQTAGEIAWWPPSPPLPDNITRYSSIQGLIGSNSAAALIISDELDPFRGCGTNAQVALPGTHIVVYRPGSLVVGMGCRRGVPAEELEDLLTRVLKEHNLSRSSVAAIATADLKQDELGLLELARKLGVPLECFGANELNSVFDSDEIVRARHRNSVDSRPSEGIEAGPGSLGETGLHPSKNARRLVGVWGVAEPAALLASGSDRLLVPKQTAARATVAVARRKFT